MCTYRRHRAACPQGPTYMSCTYWARVPASGVPYVARVVAPQASRSSSGSAKARRRVRRSAPSRTRRSTSRTTSGRLSCPSRDTRKVRSPPAFLNYSGRLRPRAPVHAAWSREEVPRSVHAQRKHNQGGRSTSPELRRCVGVRRGHLSSPSRRADSLILTYIHT